MAMTIVQAAQMKPVQSASPSGISGGSSGRVISYTAANADAAAAVAAFANQINAAATAAASLNAVATAAAHNALTGLLPPMAVPSSSASPPPLPLYDTADDEIDPFDAPLSPHLRHISVRHDAERGTVTIEMTESFVLLFYLSGCGVAIAGIALGCGLWQRNHARAKQEPCECQWCKGGIKERRSLGKGGYGEAALALRHGRTIVLKKVSLTPRRARAPHTSRLPKSNPYGRDGLTHSRARSAPRGTSAVPPRPVSVSFQGVLQRGDTFRFAIQSLRYTWASFDSQFRRFDYWKLQPAVQTSRRSGRFYHRQSGTVWAGVCSLVVISACHVC